MSVRVYIAAPWPFRDEAQYVRKMLALNGIACVSRWLLADAETLGDEWARNDLADVARCDLFLAMNPAEWGEKGTGGRHVEFGYAVALRKPVVLVGERTNIFHHLSDVIVVANLREAIEAIKYALLCGEAQSVDV